MATTTWPSDGNVLSLLEILGASGNDASWAAGVLTIEGVDQAELDAAVASYNADPDRWVLDPVRQAQKSRLAKTVYNYTLSRYSTARQSLFHALLTEAIADGLTNRATYIRQLLTWLKMSAAMLIVAEDQVETLSTVAEIRQVDVDLAALTVNDPEVTVRAALQILD